MNRHVHLVGIGGAGMSAIARVLVERGETVSGSDQTKSAFAEALEALGVTIHYGHAPENITGADLVVATSAVGDDNPEIAAARRSGVRVLRRQEFLGELTSGFQAVAIAGTHGKTTTTGLIAWILDQAGLAPSFIVGGLIGDFGTNARAGAGKVFVIEADEYDRAFLGLRPSVAVVTNVEYDHPDSYTTVEAYRRAFAEFAGLVTDLLVVCQDDPVASKLASAGAARVTYGVDQAADWRAEDVRGNAAGGDDFLVLRHGELLGLVRNRLPGLHNVRNTVAALAVADHMGVSFSQAREAVTEFRGVGRRFEVVGEVAGVTVVDDYAHHPSEIRATLAAARERFPHAEIWAVFQPHTYSRTRALMSEFAAAFGGADHVIVTDIFASREKPDATTRSEELVSKMKHPDVRQIHTLDAVVQDLLARVRPGAVVVTLTAGDANRIGTGLLAGLGAKREGGSDG